MKTWMLLVSFFSSPLMATASPATTATNTPTYYCEPADSGYVLRKDTVVFDHGMRIPVTVTIADFGTNEIECRIAAQALVRK